MTSHRAALMVLPGLVLVGAVFLAPFLLLAVTGFWQQAPGSLIVQPDFTWANYARLATDPYFALMALRTLRLSLATTALCLLLGLPVARWIVRRARAGRGALTVLMALPLVCGALLQTLGLVNLLSLLGVVNGALRAAGLINRPIRFLGNEGGVLIGLVQAFLPLMVLPLMTVMARLPIDLEAAAASLGANPLQVWRRIVLPLSAPGMVAGGVLVFCASLTAFVTPQILGQGRVPTFGTVAYQQAAQVLDWPFASALAVAILALLLAALSAGAILARRLEPAR